MLYVFRGLRQWLFQVTLVKAEGVIGGKAPVHSPRTLPEQQSDDALILNM